MWRKRVHLLALFLLIAPAAWSAEIHGRSSTQFNSFTNLFNDRRQTELGEYLRVSVTNIDKEGKIALYGYGRLTQDITNGDGLNGRLYYLYGDIRDIKGHFDFRIGRQFVNLAAGSAIIDGAQVELRNVGPVAFTLLGGRDVVFGLNGEIGDRTNTVLGMAAYLTGIKRTDAEISWFRKWDGGDVARDVIGGSVKQYLFNNLNVYGNARYDIFSESFNEVQGGIKYFPVSNLILTGEYYQSYPTFDATSIYSVFAVDRYAEAVFRADYMLNDQVSLKGGYTRQYYGEGGAANVYNAGLGLRPIEAVRINVEYDNRNGYYGSRNGFGADVGYDVTRTLQVSAGMDFDVYRRDSLTGDEIARRYWGGGKYKLAKNMAVSGRIQADVNAQYSHNVSGRLTFDYDF